MEKKALFRLLVILSCILFAAAVPATRSLLISKMDPPVQDHLPKEDQLIGLSNSEEQLDMKERVTREISRMMIDNTADYPGTRPNPSHNPKFPGGKP